MKKIIWIILIFIIVIFICGYCFLYYIFSSNKYNLKNISEIQRQEIIELLNCSEISDDIELIEMKIPKVYRDIFYEIYFKTTNENVDKLIINSDIIGRSITKLNNNKYCCTIYRLDDECIDTLEKIANNETNTENEVDYDKLKQYFEEYSTIQIFLKNNVTSKQEEDFLEKLKQLKYFKDIKFISSKESNEELRNRIGDTVGNLADYGVPDKIKINCYYLDDISLLDEKGYFEKIENEIKKIDTDNIIDNITTAGIIEIYNEEGMDAVEEYVKKCDEFLNN